MSNSKSDVKKQTVANIWQNDSSHSKENAIRTIYQRWSSYTSLTDIKFQLKYTHLIPILQSGPTCGIVALAMISSLCEITHSTEELLSMAQSLSYTKFGEMFSAYNMLHLIKRTSLMSMFNPVLYDGGLAAQRDEIIKLITNDTLLLIPYDADKNHSPGLFKGHKAHWGVVCGIITGDEEHCLLVGRQGKSLHPILWPFDNLNSSNLNLIEIDPKRTLPSMNYVTDDLAVSLRGKYIALKQIDKNS